MSKVTEPTVEIRLGLVRRYTDADEALILYLSVKEAEELVATVQKALAEERKDA